jgi:uncharacterized protein (DUF1810 family)
MSSAQREVIPPAFDLARFVAAQQEVYADALAELRNGRKRSHWMWFICPEIEGLGSSATSRRYAIRGLDEAAAYLRHPVLGPRLLECCEVLLGIEHRSAAGIFGSPDDLKLRSCATLFAAVSPARGVFHRVLDKFFAGEPDGLTLDLIGRASRSGG